MTAVTPGQALYEAVHASVRDRSPEYDYLPWSVLDETAPFTAGMCREDLETGARAAIAAYIEANGSDPVDWRAVVAEAVKAAAEFDAARAEIRRLAQALTEAGNDADELKAEVKRLRKHLAATTETAHGWRDERDRLLSETCRLTAEARSLRELLNEARIAEPHPDRLAAYAEDREADEIAVGDDPEAREEAEFLADAASLDTDFRENR